MKIIQAVMFRIFIVVESLSQLRIIDVSNLALN
jgi:hypothetical protein